MNRLNYIDAAKGLGILLMVLGHIWTESCAGIVIWLYSFHIPMFFILSGMIMKYSGALDKKTIGENVRTKCRQLIIPYITFEALYVIVIGTKQGFNYEKLQWHWYDGLFLNPVNGPLWFLLCLFVVEVAFIILNSVVKNKKCNVLVAVVLYIIPFIMTTENIQLKFIITCCTAYGFFTLGYYWFEYISSKEMRWTYVLLLLFTGMVLAMVNTKTNMYDLNYKNPLLYTGNAVVTSSAFIFLFKKISSNVLEFWGRNTIIMLALHVLCMSIIRNVIPMDYQTFYGGLIMLVLVCMMSWPIVIFVNKYIPQLVGKRK